MIDVFSMESAHHAGDALHKMFQIRHRVFIERHRYHVPALRGMEWDQFDTPATVYFLGRDGRSEPCAVGRMIPTTFPHMISSLWPDLAAEGRLPSRPDVWEISRVAVERRLPPEMRRRKLGELICAFAEFGLSNGAKSFLVISHEKILRRNLIDAGWHLDILGAPRRVGRFPVVAARVHLSTNSLLASYDLHGLDGPVMRPVTAPVTASAKAPRAEPESALRPRSALATHRALLSRNAHIAHHPHPAAM